jgi:hypothetical protein
LYDSLQQIILYSLLIMAELEDADISQLSPEEKAKYRLQYIGKYAIFIVLFFLMIAYGIINDKEIKDRLLHLIGLIGMVCVFIYNKTNTIRTYGACNNPYADLSTRIKTIVSIQCNFILFILKSMYIILGAVLVCSLIGQSIELHNIDNLGKAFDNYKALLKAIAGLSIPGLILLIPAIIFVFIFAFLHTTTFLFCNFRKMWGGDFFTVFFKRDSIPISIIFYTLYKVINITSFQNNILLIGTIISFIIGLIVVIMVDPAKACSDMIVQNKIVTALDYQMAIGWIIAFIMYFDYFKTMKWVKDTAAHEDTSQSSNIIAPGNLIQELKGLWGKLVNTSIVGEIALEGKKGLEKSTKAAKAKAKEAVTKPKNPDSSGDKKPDKPDNIGDNTEPEK